MSKATKMKFQDVVKIEFCRPYHMEEEAKDHDETMEKVWRRSVEARGEHEPVYDERDTCIHEAPNV